MPDQRGPLPPPWPGGSPGYYQPFQASPEAARLRGTGLVADEVYLLAHDDRSGRPRLGPRAVGIAVAAGLLAELIGYGAAGLREDGPVLFMTGCPWPQEEVARSVLTQIAAEPDAVRVREWLLFLARNSARDVAGRLEQAGYLRHLRGRVPGRPGRWEPVNPDWAYAPLLRVGRALDPARDFNPQHGVVAGLAYAAGLGFFLDQHLDAPGRAASTAAELLPPQLRALTILTKATVDSVVLSHRT
jgi:Golgi phosphoprotein 3 (GPP34)